MLFITQDIISIRTREEDVDLLHIRKVKPEPIEFKPGKINNLWGSGAGSKLLEQSHLDNFYNPDFCYTFKAEVPTAVLIELPYGYELSEVSCSEVLSQVFYTESNGLIYGYFLPAGESFYIQGKKIESKKIFRNLKDHPRDTLYRKKYLQKLRTNREDQGYKPEDLLSVDELAEYFGFTKGTMYNRISTGECPAITKVGNTNRFQFKDVLEYVEKNKTRF